jgi:hypothetical protein
LTILSIGLLAPAAAAQPATPGAVHIGTAFRKASREACALLAVEAMGVKEKFIQAEVMADGNAYGWSETAGVLVVVTPFRDGAHFTVIAVSQNGGEAERLRNAVRDHILTGPAEPDVARQIKADDPMRKTSAPALRWNLEARGMCGPLKHFVPAVFIAVEKHGLASSDGGIKGMPVGFGGGADRMVIAFLHPGPNEISVQMSVVGICNDAAEADRLQRMVRQELVKILFE